MLKKLCKKSVTLVLKLTMTKTEIKKILETGETEQTEFKLNFGSSVIISLNAFANAKGGKVILGVEDTGNIHGIEFNNETIQNWINEVKNKTNPSIVPNVEVVEIEKKTIVLFEIEEYPIKPVSIKGRYYKRVKNSNHQMSITEIADEHLKTVNSSWDFYPDTSHTLANISIEKIKKYIKEFEKWNNTEVVFEPFEFLSKKEILKNNKLTFGAYLLFAKELCIISDVQIGRFKSETKIIDSISLSTDILTELDEIMAFIRKHLMVEFIITGKPQREERFDYPEEAIREIVINMLIHRDYRESSGSIIKIFDDRIEFYNPGGLYGNLTIEELLSLNYKSQVRNKLIANTFKDIGKIEKYGTGMKRIFSICDGYGVIPPRFNNLGNGFEVVLFKEKLKDNATVSATVNATVNATVSDRQKQIIGKIANYKNITINQLAEFCDVSRDTIIRDIKKLKELKIIERIGSDKTGYWEILE